MIDIFFLYIMYHLWDNFRIEWKVWDQIHIFSSLNLMHSYFGNTSISFKSKICCQNKNMLFKIFEVVSFSQLRNKTKSLSHDFWS